MLRASVEFTAYELRDGVSVACVVLIFHAGFSQLASEIIGRDLWIQQFDAITESAPAAELPALLSGVMQSVLARLASTDADPLIESLARNRADPPAGSGVSHLVALAYRGEFNAIDDYHQALNRGHRAGLASEIDFAIVDRALTVVAGRMG